MKKLHHIPAFDSLYCYEKVKKKVDLNRLDTGHAYLYVIIVRKRKGEIFIKKRHTRSLKNNHQSKFPFLTSLSVNAYKTIYQC